MTLAIRIGANTTTYDDLTTAWAQAKAIGQKLSITGTGEEIFDQLDEMVATNLTGDGTKIADRIGSIKATNDLNLSTANVASFKAALIKLGTKSIVLATNTSAANVGTNFNDLDAVYSKIKSITIADVNTNTPTIDVKQLTGSKNLVGIQTLTGKAFNVTGDGADIKANMNALLANVSRIGTITVNAGQTAEFTAKELAVLGSKLAKADDAASIVLKDKADNILATSSLALINKLNNTNVNSDPKVVNITALVGTTGLDVNYGVYKSFNTGDRVVYKGADGTAGTDKLEKGGSYFARKLSNTRIELYKTYAEAVKTSSIAGRINVTGVAVGAAGIELESAASIAPVRNTTLDNIKVTDASVNQANRLIALSAQNPAIVNPGEKNRLIANIISSVEIADTATNLNTSGTTVTVAVGDINFGADGPTKGEITLAAGHGLVTGDTVKYSVAEGGTAFGGLTAGNSYYVGILATDPNKMVLFDTRAKALAADLSTQALAHGNAGGTGAYKALTTVGTLAQSFTKSNLANIMGSVNGFRDNTGAVGRVTINGSGAITANTLSDITTKIKAGNSAAMATYSAKAVDIQNNFQALYENQSAALATSFTKLNEIVVNDGTSTGKKGLTLSETYLSSLDGVFKRGVDQNAGGVGDPVKNKNYTFNVTDASYANTNTLQTNANVGAYQVTGATFDQVTNVANNATKTLALELGRSKLKTMTTVGVTDAQRVLINEQLFAIGSNPDRAKLKITAA